MFFKINKAVLANILIKPVEKQQVVYMFTTELCAAIIKRSACNREASLVSLAIATCKPPLTLDPGRPGKGKCVHCTARLTCYAISRLWLRHANHIWQLRIVLKWRTTCHFQTQIHAHG